MKNTKTPTEVTEYLVQYFETYNSLPTPVIECQASGTAYTCFGSNLKGKIEKAGGIENLLTTFIGRGVKKAEKKVAVKAVETPAVTATITKRSRPSRSKAAIAARLAAATDKDGVIHISANDLEESRVSLA